MSTAQVSPNAAMPFDIVERGRQSKWMIQGTAEW
jgi:hypothetical protein